MKKLIIAMIGMVSLGMIMNTPVAALDKTDLSRAQTLFTMKGSNTVGEKLAPELASSYLKHIGAEKVRIIPTHQVEKTIIGVFPGNRYKSIEIKAHGSSTGFRALAKRDTDIAMSSRRIKDKEVKKLMPIYGDLSRFGNEHTLAVDGLAVIVNPTVPLDKVDTETLAKLFSGDIKNWAELGFKNQPVKVFARDDNSGTYDTFKSLVLKRHKVKLSPIAERYESSGELSELVSSTPGAIGFVALPYVNDAKLLSVSESGVALSFKPNLFTVSTEDYVLSRRLYLYLPENSKNWHAKNFVEYVQQDKAQTIAQDLGLIPLTISDSTVKFNRNHPPRYLNFISDAKRLSVTFHFEPKTNDLDNKAKKDTMRLAEYVKKYGTKDIYLFGFSEDTGNPLSDRQRSEQFVDKISTLLIEHGVKPLYGRGFGNKGAISSNATEAGKNRNRRVEVWVPRY